MRKGIFMVMALLAGFTTFGQYAHKDGNRIGISGGVTQASLTTSNFGTGQELGWIGGLSVRGNYYDNWSMIFGMQFTESNFTVSTTNTLLQHQDVKYTLAGAQVRLLLSYNVIKDHVSVDFGPVLQVNGKLKINANDKNNLINGTALQANDILDITKINGNAYLGISAGTKRIRAVVFYQYGLNNILNNLNKDDLLKVKNNNSEFKGNIGILSGQLLFNL